MARRGAHRWAWALATFVALVAVGPRPDALAVAPERDRTLDIARRVMRNARYATLVTLGADGHPQARVVDPFPPEDALTVWVATNGRTRKVADVTRDPRVTLLYFDPSGPSYVTLVGRADVVRDPAEKARRWKDEWSAFYQDRNRGDDYVLLRVRAARLEVVSERDGVRNDPHTWRPTVVELP